MVTNILASDTKHEDNLVEYRRDLETRYPQVCNQCEPRVREQIRASGYAAKTDHLRRMMERTRGERGLGRWNWKSIVISLGAIGWYISLAGQLLWDVQQVVAAHRQETVGEDDLSSISTCPSSSWAISLITSKCSTNYDSAADLALDLGLFCIWWNPRLKEKSTKGGRIVGKAGYYGLQIMLHVLRSASSSVLRSPAYDFDARTVKAAHSLMFVITTVVGKIIQCILFPTNFAVAYHRLPSIYSTRLLPASLISRKPRFARTQCPTWRSRQLQRAIQFPKTTEFLRDSGICKPAAIFDQRSCSKSTLSSSIQSPYTTS